jgi:hypothetical protein
MLADVVLGAVLSRFFLVSYACGLLMGASLIGMALIGPRPRPYSPRLAVIGLMMSATAVLAYPISWHLDAVQSPVNGSIDRAARDDSRTTGLVRAGGWSGLLLSLNLGGGLTLLFWDVRERRP